MALEVVDGSPHQERPTQSTQCRGCHGCGLLHPFVAPRGLSCLMSAYTALGCVPLAWGPKLPLRSCALNLQHEIAQVLLLIYLFPLRLSRLVLPSVLPL